MKRVGNLFEQIISMENIQLADAIARRGKAGQYGIRVHDRHREENLLRLQRMMIDKTFTTSTYSIFKIYDPKERDVFRLPYYPDRIVHHMVMNILEPVFVANLTRDTYSCIKGRGIHAADKALKEALKDFPDTQYCLKLDIKKFYPSVDHCILKSLVRRKIKDKDLLWLLDDIIDSAPGLPIGNYLSQFLANFYLSPLDHWLKERMKVRYYFRYADDLVILAAGKPELHALLAEIRNYLSVHLNLEVKANYQVFPVDCRGVDFLGYVYRHTHTRIRKGIKQRFARKVAKGCNRHTLASYYGWALHANSNNLLKKLLYDPNQPFQGFRNSAAEQGLHRREDQHHEDPQHGYHRGGLQGATVKIRRQGHEAGPADKSGRATTCGVRQFPDTTGNDQAGATG